MSDKTAKLYEKNIKRLIDAGLDLNKPDSVIEWINTVKSQRGKNFSSSTKRNIYTAILSEQGYIEYKDENIFKKYKEQQDKLNDSLFKQYKKDGTVNLEKTKEKDDAFKQKDYDSIMKSLIKEFTDHLPNDKIKWIYGKMEGDDVIEYNETDVPLPLDEKDIKLWNMAKNSKVDLTAYILMKMFYLYNFRNEIGRLMIISKEDFDNKYTGFNDKELKDENFLYVDGDNFKVIRTDYKTSKSYGTIITDIDDEELKDVINTMVYGRRFVKIERPTMGDLHSLDDVKQKKLKWTKKAVKELLNNNVHISDYDFSNDKSDSNFRYKYPMMESIIMEKYLYDGFLFGDTPMDSAGVSNAIRNVGKKHLKYDTLSPNMITKLGQ
tara:strand:+ start:138 stop:1274 length:1137 start_codon:yes stop_codon:yes gene_type:complete